ncbi:PepSY domain-containing protein [Vibrio sp. YIC-376]|uniref:PepSY domain-containing protein n=1 Tax=Vibrio sp. YIC-376 TaxID=3136162 RepID=UPI00402A8356
MERKTLLTSTMMIAGLLSFGAYAGDPTCTTESQDNWMPFDTAQKMVESQGYKVKKFKQTNTGCYELYGYGTNGKRVEIYYNPVDMSVVKEEVDD